jgi:hypothetical protein
MTASQLCGAEEEARADIPGRVTFLPCALTHLRTAGTNSAFPPLPSTTNGLIAPGPSHLTTISLALKCKTE